MEVGWAPLARGWGSPHTPLDILSPLDTAVIVLYAGVFAAAAFRAVQIGQAFVNRVYRSLANLYALFVITGLVDITIVYFPFFPNASVASISIAFSRTALGFVTVGFIDRIALVANETDFFHRDSLHWRRIRNPSIIAFFATVVAFVIALTVFVPSSTPNPLVLLVEVPIALLFFGFGGYFIALVAVSARRTPDAVLRKNLRLLGFALVFLIAGIPFQGKSLLPLPIAHDLLALLGGYVFYRAVMSLSPVGRTQTSEFQVEREAAARVT